MAVGIMDPARLAQPSTSGSSLATQEVGALAHAAATYLTYTGTYEVVGETIFHDVALSLTPAAVDTTLERTVRWRGEYLVLTTPAGEVDGRSWVGELEWERALPFVGRPR